ncbi:MAG: sulfite oxidase [Thaumarchaeota archaeon]|nr:sulfite oxidase [Nitrososphaerota archaeon]
MTPTSSFFVRNHFGLPEIQESNWQLTLEFESFKFSYSIDDLKKMSERTLAATLECAGNSRSSFGKTVEGEIAWENGAVGTAIWSGVPLEDILSKSGIIGRKLREVIEVIFVGADGSVEEATPIESKNRYSRSLPIGKALDPDTIVALRMNGEALPKEQGYPARLIVPGWFAMASVKWLNTIILTKEKFPFKGYFNSTKYVYLMDRNGRTEREPVTDLNVKSLITNPKTKQNLTVGSLVTIEGKAWSGHGRITKVEVNLGNGWQATTLVDNDKLSKYAWTSWKFEWMPTQTGKTIISVRATDAMNNMQPEKPMMNSYLYGYNAIQHLEIRIK